MCYLDVKYLFMMGDSSLFWYFKIVIMCVIFLVDIFKLIVIWNINFLFLIFIDF